MANKIHTIVAKSPEDFDTQVNEFGATHNVFATQTHVKIYGNTEPFMTRYIGVVFYKEE